MFRRDVLDLICGVSGVRTMRISTDNYLAHAVNLLAGSLLIDEQLVGYRLHGSNGFNKRAPLDGFLCHERLDQPHVKTFRLFLQDLILRFKHYSTYIDHPERIFEICAILDEPDRAVIGAPNPDAKSYFAELLAEHRLALQPIVGDAMIAKWIENAKRVWEPVNGACGRRHEHDDGARICRTSIHDIAREVWFEKQRWGLPYKIKQYIVKRRSGSNG